ncbi:hypothetical protein AB1Y20_016389 [Prymnesium parvum]|uniref:Fe2OG dioxygenase domain-containing protein n=1 Tax=Prymnesium parvum TaxID=97485 RepID=A0AB34IFS2_PRYPA
MLCLALLAASTRAAPPRASLLGVARSTPPMAQLSDDAIAARMRTLRAKGRRGTRREVLRPAPPPPPLALPADESERVPVWPVPTRLRMPGAPAVTSHGEHASLDDLFPRSGLAEAWDSNAKLRTALRKALREELFRPPAHWSEAQVRAATELSAACMVSWRAVEREGRACDAFTAAFAAHGVDLDGRTFLLRLGGLCGDAAHGSLIDIVPLPRRVAHSWHQDCGISSRTVLLGFPPHDGYEGGGVFSHHVKLSHPLRPTEGEEHGAVVEYERYDPPPDPIPEEYVLRPIYSRGREIWISDDSTHLHSTPDRQNRECVWRFM